uniref:uncharacterized protein LOC124056178 isoform X2 n=1 Tax=Scatophagus argus TaxID=75038 RepID=UPI001ED85488|nr:uncharacterized protein LOC124056178 isoform X2 [Scatophagus argus]
MELKRMSLVLFILGNVAAAIALSGADKTTGENLDCTNDLTEMSCDFEAQNCTEYSLTLRNNEGHGEEHCSFKQCNNGRCCCSTKMILILGETHKATVWKGDENMGSKTISVTDSTKPRVPTITSVKESNGNFQVKWKTNMEGIVNESLMANVTYHIKGETEKVSESVRPTIVDGLSYYEIAGRRLHPSTTYVVSVKSYLNWSGLYSDGSEEWEFTTPVSSDGSSDLLAIIVSLSLAAVIISGAIYGCYVKFKAMWWDTVTKCPNPKLLNMHPSDHEVLKPLEPVMSTVCVEPLVSEDSNPWSKESLTDTSSGSSRESSGFSTGSSSLSYANTDSAMIKASVQDALGKAFANISPISPFNPLTDSGLFSTSSNLCEVRADDLSSGSSGIDNKTYSIIIPSLPHQIMADSSEVQTQAKMPCDSAYHPSEGDTVTSADQQLPPCLLVNLAPVVSSSMPTDMSYQQCNADSARFSHAEDSSLSSFSSGTNTTASCNPTSRVEAWSEHSDAVVSGATNLNGKIEEAIVCDENPCYFPTVDDDYQAFQTLVEQPDISLSIKQSDEEEEHLHKCPEESFTMTPQSFHSTDVPDFTDTVKGDFCLSELQRPFLPCLTSTNQSMPVITESGYQSV